MFNSNCWRKEKSKSFNRDYYVNLETGKSQWGIPQDFGDKMLNKNWEKHRSRSQDKIYYERVYDGFTQWEEPPEYEEETLPVGWERHFSSNCHNIYYKNVNTGSRQWIHPKEYYRIEEDKKRILKQQFDKLKEDELKDKLIVQQAQKSSLNPHNVIFNWVKDKGTWSLKSDKGVKNIGSYDFEPTTMKITTRFNGKQDKIASVMISKCMCPVSAFVNKKVDDFPYSEIKVILGSIQDLIQMKASAGRQKVFVLPSQLNGAEYPSQNSIVTELQSYMTDRTGGPAGQLAADPGVAQFIIDNAANTDTEIFDTNNGINNVRLMGNIPGITLKNGYLQVKDNADIQEFENKISQMTVLGVRDVPVRGLTSGKYREFFYADHTVDLIYGSAIPIKSDPNPKSPYYNPRADYDYGNSNHPTVIRIASVTLFAQYVGSFRLAILRGNCNIYLMLLGGGVFNNLFEDIKDAISSAYNFMKEGLKRADVKVFVVVWEGTQNKKELEAFNLYK